MSASEVSPFHGIALYTNRHLLTYLLTYPNHPTYAAGLWLYIKNQTQRRGGAVKAKTEVQSSFIEVAKLTWRRSSVVRTSVFGRRTVPALRPIYGWQVTTMWVP